MPIVLDLSLRISDRPYLFRGRSGGKKSKAKGGQSRVPKNARPCFVYRDGVTQEFESVIQSMRTLNFRLSSAQCQALRDHGWTQQVRTDLVIWYKGTEKPMPVKVLERKSTGAISS